MASAPPPKMYTAQDKQRAVEKYSEQITYSNRYSGESPSQITFGRGRSSGWLIPFWVLFLMWADDQWEYRYVFHVRLDMPRLPLLD